MTEGAINLFMICIIADIPESNINEIEDEHQKPFTKAKILFAFILSSNGN